MPTPLNPQLFRLLQQHFGEVRVSCAGEVRQVEYFPDPERAGRLAARVRVPGEQYFANCPFCGDRRRRMYVSYQFGIKDLHTGSRNESLWFCQNERCQKSPRNREILRSRLALPLGRRVRAGPSTAACQPDDPGGAPPAPVTIPEGLVAIHELHAEHPTNQYLRQRGFDRQQLSSIWQVHYCAWDGRSRPPISDAIVVPIYRPNLMFSDRESTFAAGLILAGWQARAIGESRQDSPRYLTSTGLQKSGLLYGLPQALQTDGPVCVCEGITDCWRVGPGAVGLLGKDLSRQQKLLLIHHFPNRPIVVLLDADAQEAARHITDELRQARTCTPGDTRVNTAVLPAGRNDPAECSETEIRETVAAALA